MSYKVYNSGNMVVLVNTNTWRVERLPHDKIWYEYTATDSPILYSLYYDRPERDLILDKPYTQFQREDGSLFSDDIELQAYLDSILGESVGSIISTLNSSTTPLAAGATFTGEWVEGYQYGSIIVAMIADTNGTILVQFSPDGVNLDSSLIRYYRVGQIDPPHRFTTARKYCRIVFTNTDAVDQTFFRLQTIIGDKTDLNVPLDQTIAQDYDSLSVRPTDFKYEVSLGRRQGYEAWNKWGYNLDVGIGTEVLAAFGGAFTPITTPTTISIASTSADDTNGGIGTQTVVVDGVDANRDPQTETFIMNGLTPVVSTSTWLGVNRVSDRAGSNLVNVGTIDVTDVVGGSILARVPAGQGVTQQCIFYNYRNYQFMAEYLKINAANRLKSATLTVKFWIFDVDNNSKKEVYRKDIETDVTTDISELVNIPFPIPSNAVCWIEVTSDKAGVIVNGRFSGIAVRGIDYV